MGKMCHRASGGAVAAQNRHLIRAKFEHILPHFLRAN